MYSVGRLLFEMIGVEELYYYYWVSMHVMVLRTGRGIWHFVVTGAHRVQGGQTTARVWWQCLNTGKRLMLHLHRGITGLVTGALSSPELVVLLTGPRRGVW